MDHTELLTRVLREITNARTAIAISYQRLWRPAQAPPADPDEAQPDTQSVQEPATDEERPSAGSGSG